MRLLVTINYVDGKFECTWVDSCERVDDTLVLYDRVSGERHILLHAIKEWKVER